MGIGENFNFQEDVRETDPNFRAGFVAVVGRPNVGKSTLTNALVSKKIAITSSRPQTTRHNIRGIVTVDSGQIVLVDTPGYHRPRTPLGKRLNDMTRGVMRDVDVTVVCYPADQKVGPGDRFITDEAKRAGSKMIAVVTKLDKVSSHCLAEHLIEVDALADWHAVVPVSAKKVENLETLQKVLIQNLPISPQLYPTGQVTEESHETLIQEFIRESALEGVHDELPHSLAVRVDEIVYRPGQKGKLVDIHATIFVERDSQKAIVIGKGGAHLKQVGTSARHQIESLLGLRVYLHLHVAVSKNWQTNLKGLSNMGF